MALLTAVVAISATMIGACIVVPRLFRLSDAAQSREIFLLAVLNVGLGTAWAMSAIGLSLSLGALLAGMMLADAGYGEPAVATALPLRDVLLSIFFVSLGMLVDPGLFLDEPVTILAIVAALLLGKTVVTAVTATLTVMSCWRASAWPDACSATLWGRPGSLASS